MDGLGGKWGPLRQRQHFWCSLRSTCPRSFRFVRTSIQNTNNSDCCRHRRRRRQQQQQQQQRGPQQPSRSSNRGGAHPLSLTAFVNGCTGDAIRAAVPEVPRLPLLQDPPISVHPNGQPDIYPSTALGAYYRPSSTSWHPPAASPACCPSVLPRRPSRRRRTSSVSLCSASPSLSS